MPTGANTFPQATTRFSGEDASAVAGRCRRAGAAVRDALEVRAEAVPAPSSAAVAVPAPALRPVASGGEDRASSPSSLPLHVLAPLRMTAFSSCCSDVAV